MSSSSATSGPTVLSTSISIPDDDSPFLSKPSTTSSSGGLPSVSATTSCLRTLQRRFLSVRRCLSRASLGLHMSRAANGLTVIVALVTVGVVSTFALRQMMSPEIDALTQQRERLRNDVVLLHLQIENMTRIADSRLETVHLLETELERQHVQAVEAAATVTSGIENNAILDVNYNEVKGEEIRPDVVLPTVFYTLLLGSVVLASVLYRIFFIVRNEISAQQKKMYMIDNDSSKLMMLPDAEPSMDDRRNGRGAPPLSSTRSLNGNTLVSSGGRNGASNLVNLSLSPKTIEEAVPQCYKRAPGLLPTTV